MYAHFNDDDNDRVEERRVERKLLDCCQLVHHMTMREALGCAALRHHPPCAALSVGSLHQQQQQLELETTTVFEAIQLAATAEERREQ